MKFTRPWKLNFYLNHGDSRLFLNVSNYLQDYSEDKNYSRFIASVNGSAEENRPVWDYWRGSNTKMEKTAT